MDLLNILLKDLIILKDKFQKFKKKKLKKPSRTINRKLNIINHPLKDKIPIKSNNLNHKITNNLNKNTKKSKILYLKEKFNFKMKN